jgi:streptogramin lyase
MLRCLHRLSRSTAPARTNTSAVTEFFLPKAVWVGDPFGITAGRDGVPWFTAALNKVGRLTPTGSFRTFPVPIGCNPSGYIWCVGRPYGKLQLA